MVEIMFHLGFFHPRRKPIGLYEGIILWMCMIILREREREEEVV